MSEKASPTPVALRRFVLTRVVVLVIAITLMIAAAFSWFGLLPMAEQVAKGYFEVAAQRLKSKLDITFAQPQRLLPLSLSQLQGVMPDLQDPTAFNRLFEPMLTVSPEISSVVAAASTGQGWMLVEKPEGGWRNRMTDVVAWGTKLHLFIDRDVNGIPRKSWAAMIYDPRLRPWYQAAMVPTPSEAIHWTSPYTFLTTGDPGITASSATRLKNGSYLVLGFDLTLKDVSKSAAEVSMGTGGMALVLTADDRVLSLPPAPDGISEADWSKRALKPASELGFAPITDGLARWHRQAKKSDQVMRYASDGQQWLASMTPYAVGDQRFWIMVLAPASTFSPAWVSIGVILIGALVLVFMLSTEVARNEIRRLTTPLEDLARTSARVGMLDFEPGPPVVSHVAEIRSLVNAHETMLGLLQSNQLELNRRADQHNDQITALLTVEEKLQKRNDMLNAIIDNFPGGVLVVDAQLNVVAYNDQLKKLLKLPSALFERLVVRYEDLIRYAANRGDYGVGEPETFVVGNIDRVRQKRPDRMERIMPNGSVLDVRGMPLPGGGFVDLYVDISAIKAHQRELEHIAHYDALTSLPNRVLLGQRLRLAMSQALRSGQRLAVGYLDLDGFKEVNDRHGHEVGDRLLVVLANSMKQVLRDGDTLARLGGDEFVVVMLDIANEEQCAPMLERLLAAASDSISVDRASVRVSASLGVTFFPQAQEVDADQLLRQADQAMYQAKQAGKNRFRAFDAARDMSQRGHFEGLERIRQALAQQEFVLYFQPKINMRLGTVVGAEALIRWQHPQLGLLAPSYFLPVVEDDLLSVEIGEWVISTALRQMEQWHEAGLNIGVSVNVGALQLQRSGFVGRLRQILDANPYCNPKDLEIEVLETSALEDIGLVTEVIHACRALGVTFALDDFGTGYSSLTYLKRLPVTTLKIDQSFVRDMLDDPDDLSILLGVLDLSAAFNRGVVAEGVETVEHGAMLLQLGCQLAQGYGIARPMPGPDMPAWAANWRSDVAWVGLKPISRDDLPLVFAAVEHRVWIAEMAAYLRGDTTGLPAIDVHNGRFGQWVQIQGAARYANQPEFVLAQSLYEQTLELAATVHTMHAAGKVDRSLTEFKQLYDLRCETLVILQALLHRATH